MFHPRVTLKTGVCVANFSSPHSFTFDDGSVLEHCAPEMANALKLDAVEIEHRWPIGFNSGLGVDVELSFKLTKEVAEALLELEHDPCVDIILVPLPVMTALKSADMPIGKARVCRVADRVTKVICSNKFCL